MALSKHKDSGKLFLLEFGQNIKRRRQKKGYTLEKLGLEIGLTRMDVHRVERGYNITMITLLKLAIALNVKPENLIKVKQQFKKEDLEFLVNTNKANRK